MAILSPLACGRSPLFDHGGQRSGGKDAGSNANRDGGSGTGGSAFKPDGGAADRRGTGGRAGSAGGAGGLAVDGGRGGAGGASGPIFDGGDDAAGGASGSDGGSLDGGSQCDPVLQDCGAGLRCDITSNGLLVFACVQDLGGKGQQDAICATTSRDCIRGSVCLQDTDRFGNPIGLPRCTLFCNIVADCPPGGRCLLNAISDMSSSITTGICVP